MRGYHHLSYNDRIRIETMILDKKKPREIAARLHVHISTIYRELKRGRYTHLDGGTWIFEDRYNPDEAHRRYREMLLAKGAMLKIGNDHAFAQYIERKILIEKRSPAAALADMVLEGQQFKTRVCVSTLYSYIDKGVFLKVSRKDLPDRGERKRKPKKKDDENQKRPSRGESIERRPLEILERVTFGNWEMDTVYSKKDGSKALLVLTERLTRKEIIIRIPDRTALSVVKALDKLEWKYGSKFRRIFQTITVDNGSEFASVELMERSTLQDGRRTVIYYCHPYSSYERGSNECMNKMIRRQLPKGTDFAKVSLARIQEVENWMNNYPRAVLGWKTAEIFFQEQLANLA